MAEGAQVACINADLSSTQQGTEWIDVSRASRLIENVQACFQGSKKIGSFDVPDSLARAWLLQPNASGFSNADVLFPYRNGIDIVRQPRNVWIVDFGLNRTVEAAALYELPFEYVLKTVKPERDTNRRDVRKKTGGATEMVNPLCAQQSPFSTGSLLLLRLHVTGSLLGFHARY